MDAPTDPVAVTSTADVPAHAHRRVKTRPGRWGLLGPFAVFLMPHVWAGVVILIAGLGQLAFPLLCHDVDGEVVALHESTGRHGHGYSAQLAYKFEGETHQESMEIGAREFATTS